MSIDKKLRNKFLKHDVGFGKHKYLSRFQVVEQHPNYVEYLAKQRTKEGKKDMGQLAKDLIIAFHMNGRKFKDEWNQEWEETWDSWMVNHPELHCLV